MILDFAIHQLEPYINWVYFFHSWGFAPRFATIATLHGCDACRASWLTTFDEAHRAQAAQAMQLHKEAVRMLHSFEPHFAAHAAYRLCRANAQGDNLILDDVTLPLLRQQTRKQPTQPYLCLSDFVRPLSTDVPDTVGVFACTVDPDMERMHQTDPYKHLLAQTLADRLVEAATECMHLHVRKEAWAYAPHEDLSVSELMKGHYQGIRPAVGYPSLPDQSVNHILAQLLPLAEIGITLTENGAMHPHASTSGLMLAHPQARYFAVGKIGEDQLQDYAARRGMGVEKMRKFLEGNL